MGTRFIAPMLNDHLVDACQMISPLYLKLSAQLRVDVEQSVHDAFSVVSGSPAIICPNHAASDDALVAFELSQKVGEHFHFLTTREIFRWHPTFRSTWLQNLGCYSILRAAPDIESYKTSCRLLGSGANRVLIFPEGEVSHQNAFLLPLEFGLVHLALQAAVLQMNLASKRPVFIIPTGIFYRFDDDITAKLESILQQYEQILGLTATGVTSERVYRCFDRLLTGQEQGHNLMSKSGEPLEARVQRLCGHLVRELCLRTSLELPETTDLIDKLHLLKNKFIERRYCDHVEPSDEEKAIYQSILRVTTLIAVRDHSFDSPMTQESLGELLQILSVELSQESFIKAAKTAFIGAGKPLDVSPVQKLHQAEKRKAVSALADELRQSIEEVLAGLAIRHPSCAIVD